MNRLDRVKIMCYIFINSNMLIQGVQKYFRCGCNAVMHVGLYWNGIFENKIIFDKLI